MRASPPTVYGGGACLLQVRLPLPAGGWLWAVAQGK